MLNIFRNIPDPSSVEPKTPAPQLPAGAIECAGRITSADSGLVALACDGWLIKQKIDALQKELKVITERLENSLGAGAVLAVDGVCRVTLSERTTFKLDDPETCAALLGGRFADLVDSAIQYPPTDKLKEIVFDPDHPLAASLRACFTIKNATAVTFRPGKAL